MKLTVMFLVGWCLSARDFMNEFIGPNDPVLFNRNVWIDFCLNAATAFYQVVDLCPVYMGVGSLQFGHTYNVLSKASTFCLLTTSLYTKVAFIVVSYPLQ